MRNALTELNMKAGLLDVLNNASFFCVFTFFRIIVLPFWMYGFWFNMNPSSPVFLANIVTLASCMGVFLLSVFWYVEVAVFPLFGGHGNTGSLALSLWLTRIMMIDHARLIVIVSVTGSSKWSKSSCA